MTFLHQVAVVLVLLGCIIYHAHGQAVAVADDDCENRVYTNADVTTTALEMKFGNQTFQPSPKFIASLECCAKRKQNAHCTQVCNMRARKWLNENGSWSHANIVRFSIEQFQMDAGPEITLAVFECLDKYGPYKPSGNCRDIEKHVTCFQDIFSLESNGQLKFSLVNSNHFDESNLKCGNRTYHVPEPYLEYAQICSEKSKKTYEMIKCTWRSVGILDGNMNLNINATAVWYKLIFGKRGAEVLGSVFSPLMNNTDIGQVFRGATDGKGIALLSEYLASATHGYSEVCGYSTNDFINTE